MMDMMQKNPDNWKWIFYVNPKDPRVVVPKMNPAMGWTLNLGNKSTWIGFTIIFLILVTFTFLL